MAQKKSGPPSEELEVYKAPSLSRAINFMLNIRPKQSELAKTLFLKKHEVVVLSSDNPHISKLPVTVNIKKNYFSGQK